MPKERNKNHTMYTEEKRINTRAHAFRAFQFNGCIAPIIIEMPTPNCNVCFGLEWERDDNT